MNEWSYISTPPARLHSVEWEHCTFYLCHWKVRLIKIIDVCVLGITDISIFVYFRN